MSTIDHRPKRLDLNPVIPATTARADAPAFKVAHVPKSTLREHIADGLRGAILRGDIAPGSPIVESALAGQFRVSRGPLREAIRQLVDEGLLITVAYTGTSVIDLSVEDVREIYSLRIALETFAFEYAWDRRDAGFTRALQQRQALLTASIDRGDDENSILAELDLHGLIYEFSGHRLLQKNWSGLRGRLQLYWAAHHRAHGMRGPRRDSHDSYVAAATGNDLGALRAEIRNHMLRGAERTERFMRGEREPAPKSRAPAGAAPQPRNSPAPARPKRRSTT